MKSYTNENISFYGGTLAATKNLFIRSHLYMFQLEAGNARHKAIKQNINMKINLVTLASAIHSSDTAL